MDNNQLNNIFGSILSKLDPTNSLRIEKQDNGLFTVTNQPLENKKSNTKTKIPSKTIIPSQHSDLNETNKKNKSTTNNVTTESSLSNDHNFTTTTSTKKGQFDTIFGKYFSNFDGEQKIIINQNGVFLVDSNKKKQETEIKKNQNHLNEIVDAQLENSERVYNSVHVQFVLFFIATLILLGFVFIINASGNLSIFVVIILLIVLFLIFKFLRFNIVNFISNFRL